MLYSAIFCAMTGVHIKHSCCKLKHHGRLREKHLCDCELWGELLAFAILLSPERMTDMIYDYSGLDNRQKLSQK